MSKLLSRHPSLYELPTIALKYCGKDAKNSLCYEQSSYSLGKSLNQAKQTKLQILESQTKEYSI